MIYKLVPEKVEGGGCTLYIVMYSVTKSQSNSLLGDVVLDTFNNVSRDEDTKLDQIYKKQVCPDLNNDNF